MASSIFDKILTLVLSSILALNALMLVIDERTQIFSYIFGIDIRYFLAIGIIGFAAVTSIVQRFR